MGETNAIQGGIGSVHFLLFLMQTLILRNEIYAYQVLFPIFPKHSFFVMLAFLGGAEKYD